MYGLAISKFLRAIGKEDLEFFVSFFESFLFLGNLEDDKVNGRWW